jgi:hypothetical protein
VASLDAAADVIDELAKAADGSKEGIEGQAQQFLKHIEVRRGVAWPMRPAPGPTRPPCSPCSPCSPCWPCSPCCPPPTPPRGCALPLRPRAQAAQGLVLEAVQRSVGEKDVATGLFQVMAKASVAAGKVDVVQQHLRAIQAAAEQHQPR